MATGPAGTDPPRPHPDTEETAGSSDVRLEVPAEARFARVVRVAVSAAAVQRRLEVTAIEDLRIAVDESLVLLLRARAGTTSTDLATPPERSIVVTIGEESPDLDVDLRLHPAPDRRLESVEDREALARFTELVPPRVTVMAVDPDAGSIRLHLG